MCNEARLTNSLITDVKIDGVDFTVPTLEMAQARQAARDKAFQDWKTAEEALTHVKLERMKPKAEKAVKTAKARYESLLKEDASASSGFSLPHKTIFDVPDRPGVLPRRMGPTMTFRFEQAGFGLGLRSG